MAFATRRIRTCPTKAAGGSLVRCLCLQRSGRLDYVSARTLETGLLGSCVERQHAPNRYRVIYEKRRLVKRLWTHDCMDFEKRHFALVGKLHRPIKGSLVIVQVEP
jgi:hypothetical protein